MVPVRLEEILSVTTDEYRKGDDHIIRVITLKGN